MNRRLFAGEPGVFGGLSNEDELVKICPDEFIDRHNKWSEYCSKIFFSGADISNWKWKVEHKTEQLNQLRCFRALLGSFAIKHEHKEAVAGWMLSEMLTEVPEYLKGKEK